MAYTTIKKPSDYFNTVTYTGTNATQTISGVGHQPDFIWVKNKTDAGYDHSLHNSVSGLLKQLISNSDSAEITNTDTITSNNSDGFVLGADTAGPNANSNNQDTKNYVAWNWKANGAGVANTDGSISSTVSADTTSGFSIVSYTGNGTAGATVGHGLSSVPEFILVKGRSVALTNWKAQHVSTGTNVGILNATNTFAADSTTFNNTLPTSSVFTIGTESSTNTNNGTYIAYCFHSVKGFSKFGSYLGNGNADGAFIYTGFKPAFAIFKKSAGTGSWAIQDNKRTPFNVQKKSLFANLSDAETDSTNDAVDFLSNGFKFRSDTANYNTNGDTYIYMAFAEQPLVGDNPATAR
jgi:hypothetical protein